MNVSIIDTMQVMYDLCVFRLQLGLGRYAEVGVRLKQVYKDISARLPATPLLLRSPRLLHTVPGAVGYCELTPS